jgi:predicted nicotinamide N-methyase
MTGQHEAFLRRYTGFGRPPLVPEIELRVAEEPFSMWEHTREYLGDPDAPMPFWAFAWAGGQALARHVLDHPELVRGKSVLDVGSGSGLVAIAAVLAGAELVRANEIDPLARYAIDGNAARNGVAVAPEPRDLLDGDAEGADVVLIGDLCYEQPVAGRIKSFVDRVAAAERPVLLGDPGRSYLPFGEWVKVASYPVAAAGVLEGAATVTSSVWQPG